MLLEKDCTGEALFKVVSSLLTDTDTLVKMSEAQKTLAVPNAAERIAEEVMKLLSSQDFSAFVPGTQERGGRGYE